MIPFLRPYLPDPAAYRKRLERVWGSGRLTNGGPMVDELTERLADAMGVPHVLPVANGTLALQIALRTFDVRGVVLTTPYTFRATAAAIRWQGSTPVWGDVDGETWNLDTWRYKPFAGPSAAIMPVHVYGNPCDVTRLAKQASTAAVPLIYDAAHAFGVRVFGRSLFSFGDAACLSLHATKLVHSGEGGAIAFRSHDALERARELVQFGPGGINARMSEVHAALGLCVLDDLPVILERRHQVADIYRARLRGAVELQSWHKGSQYVPSFFPVAYRSARERDGALAALAAGGVEARPGFPALSEEAEDLSARILCLPIYPDLAPAEAHRICDTLLGVEAVA